MKWSSCPANICGPLSMVVSAMLAACTPAEDRSDHTPVVDLAPESARAPAVTSDDVALAPAVLRSKGDYAFDIRDWESAREHYAAALGHAGDNQIEQAAAHLSLAKLSERRGLGDEATTHMRRAQALHPSPFAEQWLAGGRNCGVEVLADLSPIASSETWRSSVTRLAAVADIRVRAQPNSQAAAQRLVCGEHRCAGPGPWIIGLLTPAGEPIEYLAVVLPRSDGTLAMLADGWYSNPSWECNHKNRLHAERIEDTSQLVHVRVERASGVGEWHSCRAAGVEGCIEYCREATVITYDWFLDPDTLASLAVTTRSKQAGPWDGREDFDLIDDASSIGGDVDLEVDGRSIELIGCGVRTRVSL